MPDLYTRMHAASVTDTLGAGLLLLGFMLQAGLSLVLLKLVFLFLLFFFIGPGRDACPRQCRLALRDQAAAFRGPPGQARC